MKIRFMKIFRLIAITLIATICFSQNSDAQTTKPQKPKIQDTYWQENGRNIDPMKVKILFFTDGLMNGYGLPDQGLSINSKIVAKTAYMRLQMPPAIKTMSSDGMTTSSAVTKVKDVIMVRPHLVILSVGINDAIKNADTDIIHNNLSIVLTELQRAGIYTMIVGMQSTPQMGSYEYMSSFNSIYAKLATQFAIPFMPYILETITGDPLKFQNNNIFPNAEGAEIVAESFVRNNLSPAAGKIDTLLLDNRTKLQLQRYREWSGESTNNRKKNTLRQ